MTGAATNIEVPEALPGPLRLDWRRLAARTIDPAPFSLELLDGLPAPARRWLEHAIAPGTPLRRAAVLHQRGEIKVGRWQRFEADWALAPPEGFIWAATTHLGPLFIRGFDRYTAGSGQTAWRLLGRIPFLSAEGPDVDRSALGRLVGELCFVPAAALPPLVSLGAPRRPAERGLRRCRRLDASGHPDRRGLGAARAPRPPALGKPRRPGDSAITPSPP